MTIKPGAFRFNTDSMKLEIFRGSANYEGTASMAGIGTLAAGQWEEIQATSPEVQTGGTRGLFGGGYISSSDKNSVDYVNVDSTGNAINFGDLTYSDAFICKGGAASRVRGLFQGGRTAQNTINGLTFASTGSAFDFGNLTQGREDPAGVSNSTRGVFMAGGQHPGSSPYTPYVNTIDYVTIASAGDAVNFGDTTVARRHQGTCCSQTRGVCVDGYVTPNVPTNVMDYITISTLGNAADFGDTLTAYYGTSAASNSTRGIIATGLGPSGATSNVIAYITFATLGNAQDFGDMTVAAQYSAATVSSPTRAVIGGGSTPSMTNTIDYVQIMTTGDAVDFGDLTTGKYHGGGTSNGHGGL